MTLNLKHNFPLLISLLFVIFSVPLTLFAALSEKVFVTPRAENQNQTVLNQKVFFLAFDPFLPKKQMRLSEYFSWLNNPPDTLPTRLAGRFRDYSKNHVNFTIVKSQIVNDFPPKINGFKHTEDTFLECEQNPQSHSYCESDADWNAIINTYDFCGMANRGEIDEIWIDAPPRGGFYESLLLGPFGFPYNGPTFTSYGCSKTVPIVAMQYAVGVENAIHNFGHRMEATMTKIYGRWQGNNPNPNTWEKFGMTHAESPSFSYAGCGSIHYAPNSSDYQNGAYHYDLKSYYDSLCDDFYNYPNLGNPLSVKKSVNCDSWGCTEAGYYAWWFKHFPSQTGADGNTVLNDWWKYFLNPNKVLNILGDIDQNGKVDIFDYNRLVQYFASTTCGNIADIDENCKVDIFDYNILVTNFGKTR